MQTIVCKTDTLPAILYSFKRMFEKVTPIG